MNCLMKTLEPREGTVVKAIGANLILKDGRRLLDCFCNSGTANLGYSSPEITQAIHRLHDTGIHSLNLYALEERDRAAERLATVTDMDQVFFCNSGTEAVEAAIKLCRKYQSKSGRSDIWAMSGGFHGRTYGSMAASDSAPYHKEGFEPHLPGVHHFTEINDIPKNAAGVLLCPIQCNNDVGMYPEGWLAELREYTKRHGILLIFDEVQTGAGRTGAWTFARLKDIRPDIVAMAKGLGMGVPVGACLAVEEVANAFTPGVHFSTFGGNPMACVFMNALLDYLTHDRLCSIQELGFYFRRRLVGFDWASNVRGAGFMLAFDTRWHAQDFATAAEAEGLIIGAWRPQPVKLTPPLNTDREGIDAIVEALDRTNNRLEAERKR